MSLHIQICHSGICTFNSSRESLRIFQLLLLPRQIQHPCVERKNISHSLSTRHNIVLHIKLQIKMSTTNTAPQDYDDSYNAHPQRLLKLMDKTDESRKLVQKARAMCSHGEIAFLDRQMAMFSSSSQKKPSLKVKRSSRRTKSDLDISERSRTKSISFDVSVSSPKTMNDLHLVHADNNDSRLSLGSRRASPMQPSTKTYAKELNFYCEEDCMSTSITSKRSRSQTFDASSSSRRGSSRSLHDNHDCYPFEQTRESCHYANEEVIRSSPSKRYRSHTFDVSNSSRERSAGYDFHDCSSCNSFNCRKRCVSMDHLKSSTHSDFALKEASSRSYSSNLPTRPMNNFCAEERSIAAVSNTGSYNNLPSSTYEESYEPHFGQDALPDDDELSLLSFASAL